MSSTFDFVMTEHPAWLQASSYRRVLALPGSGRYLATVSGRQLVLHPLVGGGGEPTLDCFTLSNGLLSEVPELATALGGLGTVIRFRNADLWDAIGTAIIRQVIRAGQSKKLYRTFCSAYGEQVELPTGGTHALFPSPEIVLGLASEQFASVGMAFKRRPLLAAAEAYLEHGTKWRDLAPRVLID